MQKFVYKPLVAALAALVITTCKPPPPPPPEESLRVSTNTAALNETPGPDTEFNLIVESAMPPAGVKIAVVVRGEIDNFVYYSSPPFESASNITKVNIYNLPRQIICICSITVASKSKSTNFRQTSFRVVYK